MKWTRQWAATAPSPTHPDRNEDSYWIAASGQAVAVIDGMGGYRRRTPTGEVGGEHAATLSSQTLASHLDGWDASIPFAESKAPIRAALEAVNHAIWRSLNRSGQIPAEENVEGKPLEELTVGIAVTVIALCDGGARAVVAQHGDTHGYVLKPMGFIQVTEDQDLLMWERTNGLVTEEDVADINDAIDNLDGVTFETVPDQRVLRYFYDKNIFGALGVEGNCPETGWSAIKLQAQDRLVLLSDGAYSNLSKSELQGLAALDTDPAAAIVEIAVQRGVMPRFPIPGEPNESYNMRATQDDMTAVIVVLGDSESGTEDDTTTVVLPVPEDVTTEVMPVAEEITPPLHEALPNAAPATMPDPTADTDPLPKNS